MQKDYENPANVHKTYWYVHDRLGSIRQVLAYHEIPSLLNIVHSYGYTPYGPLDAGLCYDAVGESENPFRFTGQWYDAEIGQYYLRARMYDSELMRFTSRDPFSGLNSEPLTLHKYLYCFNNPANRTDPSGLYTGYDDLAFGVAGAIGGFLEQALTDLLTGRQSDAKDYFAAVFGGFLGGVASLYAGSFGKIAGGAVQGLVAEAVEQMIKGEFNEWAIIRSGITGMVPGPSIPGITTGRGSFAAVTAQMITKMRKGLVHRITGRTFCKIVAHNVVADFYADLLNAGTDKFMKSN